MIYMAGKFIKSRRDVLHQADQFHTVKDEVLRGYFISMADQLNEMARDEIVRIYNDPELASAYRAWRNFNDLNNNGMTDKGNMREIVRIPSGHVYEFLKAYFQPVYGDNWLQVPKVLKHQLIRPWWLVSKI
jgi:hypothetical protein